MAFPDVPDTVYVAELFNLLERDQIEWLNVYIANYSYVFNISLYNVCAIEHYDYYEQTGLNVVQLISILYVCVLICILCLIHTYHCQVYRNTVFGDKIKHIEHTKH